MQLLTALTERRKRLAELLPGKTALLFNGRVRYRNIAAVPYRFRGSSHFIFLCGQMAPGAVAMFSDDESVLFLESPIEDGVIWHGPEVDWTELKKARGFHHVLPRSELPRFVEKLGKEKIQTLPLLDPLSINEIQDLLGREPDIAGPDNELAQVMIELRLVQDEYALHEIRWATSAAISAHKAGMRETSDGTQEWEVLAAMERECAKRGMTAAYSGIVSVHGEILHNESYGNTLCRGDLLLADFAAESPGGYASDVTRTCPVSGEFSSAQQDIYQLVLAAQKAAVAMVRPGVRYRDLHIEACTTLVQGFVDLGLMRGRVDSIVESGGHALFFPHGIGHLVGLDVHDMEDLTELVSYAPGRTRSKQFGLCFLRLDRDLQPGMVVTVEPGFYMIPALLNDRERFRTSEDFFVREKFANFETVRGIRIEDIVLVTEKGCEVLSQELPREPAEVEALVGRSA